MLARMYQERRVRVRDYAPIPARDPRLVLVPGIHGGHRWLHWRAAQSLSRLDTAALEAGVGPILVASGWRKHRWQDRAHYERACIERFGSVAEGRKWLAFNSPHETGLAIDIGSGGLWPTRSTRDKQRETPLHRWLVDNAHAYGWTPYKREPWHWECNIPRDQWEQARPVCQ